MKYSILLSSLLAALAITACDKPTVVNTPPTTIVVPGPAGPAGDAGVKGNTGNQGDQGVQGNEGDKGATGSDGATVVVVPPAEPVPAN